MMSKILTKLGMMLETSYKITDKGYWQWVNEAGEKMNFGWLADLFKVLNPILYAVMAVVGAAGAIYAIILGINLAKAEDTSKRDEAKKHLITVLIAVGITIALVLFFTQLMPKIIEAFVKPEGWTRPTTPFED